MRITPDLLAKRITVAIANATGPNVLVKPLYWCRHIERPVEGYDPCPPDAATHAVLFIAVPPSESPRAQKVLRTVEGFVGIRHPIQEPEGCVQILRRCSPSDSGFLPTPWTTRKRVA